MQIRIVCVLLGALAVEKAICQSEPFLDATILKVPRQNDNRRRSGGIASGCLGHTGKPCLNPLPVKITLLSLDKESYYNGEPLVLEVRLENIGDKPLLIPWTRDWRLLDRRNPKPDALIFGIVSPIIEQDLTGKYKQLVNKLMAVNRAHLFGSTEVSGTLITLPPGGTARIRTPGMVVFASDKVNFPVEIVVRAEIVFLEGPLSHNYATQVSGNAITIKVTGPK